MYSCPDIIKIIKLKRLRWADHVARMGEERGAYRIVVGKPDGKRPVGRPRRRWRDNVEMDLMEISRDGKEYIDLAQDRQMEGLCCCSHEPPGLRRLER